jgi:hypothetical protein
MLLNLFLKLLSFLGRRKDFYTFAGEHIATRWYLLYEEEDEDTRWIAKFPNIYFHHTLVEHPDGPDTHRHAWNSWSWCLRGGYSEWVNGQVREHKAPGVVSVKANEFHRIITCKPGSITMWIRGFRKGKWAFKMKPCDTICNTCETNYGRCLNEFTELSHDQYFGGKGNKRASGWHKPSLELERKMTRRRAAIQHYTVKVQSRDQIMAEASKKAHDSKST